MKLSRFFFRLVGLLVVVVLVLAGLVVFAQTEAGFRMVLAPTVQALGFGTLEAQSGRVGLDGYVEIEQGRYSWSEIGLEVEVDRLEGRIQPLSLFEEGPILIEAANVQNGQITLTPADDRGDASGTPGAGSQASAASGTGGAADIDLPVLVEEAVIASTTFTLKASDRTTTIGPFDAKATDWKPDENGRISWSGDFRTQNPGSDAMSGHAKIEGTFEADSRALPKLWDLDCEVQTFFPSDQEMASAKFNLKGSYGSGGTLALETEGDLAARLPEGSKFGIEKVSFDFSQDAKVRPSGLLELNVRGRERRGDATFGFSVQGAQAKDDPIRIDVKVANLDFEPFVGPFLPRESGASKEPAAAQEPDSSQGSPPAKVSTHQEFSNEDKVLDPFELSVSIQRSRLRNFDIGRFSTTVNHDGGRFEAHLNAKDVARGDARINLTLDPLKPRRLEADLDISRLHLDPIMDLFVSGKRSVDGRLSARGAFFSTAPGSAPILDGLGGQLGLQISDGKITGFDTLNLLAKGTGISALGNFVFSRLNGDFLADEGLVTVKKLKAGGLAVDLRVSGTVDLRGEGQYDLTLNPRVGPELASKATAFRPLARLLQGAENLLSLPVNVRVTGPLADPKASLEATSLRQTVSTHGGTLATDVLDTATLGQAGKILSPLTDGLLGRKKRD